MTPIGAATGMKEGSSNHEERRFRTTYQACRDGSHRLKNRQLHKAGIGKLCFIQPTRKNMQFPMIKLIVTISGVGGTPLI